MTATRRGTVVVAVIAALVVLQLLVYAVAVAGAREQDLTTRRLDAARSFYAAEAAANMAIREIAKNLDEDGNGEIGGVFSADTVTPVGASGAPAWATTATAAGVTTITASSATGLATRTISATVQRTAAATVSQGLFVEMWALSISPSSLGNVPWNTAAQWATVMPNVNLPSQGSIARWPGGPTGRYGIRFLGSITIPTSGNWNFRTSSDDGSDLWIDGVRVVNNDGLHSNRTVSGSIALAAGTYSFECRMFENGGSSNLWAEWQGPGVASWTLIPASAFTCSPPVEIPPVAVATTISITGGSGLPQAGADGFDSSLGPYSGASALSAGVLMSTNATAASQWTVSGNAAVSVDGRVGPGASASSVIRVTAPATMSGSNASLATRIGPMIQGRPLALPASSGAYSSNAQVTISTDRRYTSFSASGNATITIVGNVSLIIESTLTLNGNASIVLAPNASLDLYVGDAITLSGNSSINGDGGIPGRVRLSMFNTASRDLTVNGSARLGAIVRNPFGRLVLGVATSSTSEFFGAFHGNALTVSQNARLHADVAALPSSGSQGGGAGNAVVKAWTLGP